MTAAYLSSTYREFSTLIPTFPFQVVFYFSKFQSSLLWYVVDGPVLKDSSENAISTKQNNKNTTWGQIYETQSAFATALSPQQGVLLFKN